MEYPIEIESLPPVSSNFDKNGNKKQNHIIKNNIWYLRCCLDILVGFEGVFYPIELKYKTCLFDCTVNKEKFNLKEQGAVDLNMYEMWLDVSRIERMKKARIDFQTGYAIWLTNDKHYINTVKQGNKYYNFATSDNRTVSNTTLKWVRNPQHSHKTDTWCDIPLRNKYTIKWQTYSDLAMHADPGANNALFKIAILKV